MADKLAEKDAEIARMQTLLAAKDAEIAKFQEEERQDDNADPNQVGSTPQGTAGHNPPGMGGQIPPGPGAPLPGQVPALGQGVQPYFIQLPYFYPQPDLSGDSPVPEENPFADYCKSKHTPSQKEDDDDVVCDAIPEAIAQKLEEYFWGINTGKDIAAAQKECKRPANVAALKPLQINEEVKRSMTSADNSKDNTMKFICKAMVKGAQPLASIWATLTEMEYHIQEDTGLDDSEDKKIACPEGFSVNVSDLLRQLELALKVLGMAHVQGCQKRRLDLRDKINNSGKELADANQKLGPELFGENLKEHYRQIQENNRLTSITATPKSKKKTHGSGQRFSPYQQHFLPRGPAQWHPMPWQPPFRPQPPQGQGRGYQMFSPQFPSQFHRPRGHHHNKSQRGRGNQRGQRK